MEVKNVSLFFIGLIILIVGIFIVIFDYPQINYFENMEETSYFLLEDDIKNIHQRLKIEISIGIMILISGIVLIIFSQIKKSKQKD